jgi:hypothetical protein
LDSDALWEFLKEKGAVSATIAKEDHKDGQTHLHCFGKFDRKRNIRDCKYFDFQGVHPNIQSPRNKKATLDYVKKDGNYKDYGDSTIDSNHKWTDYISSSRSPEDFINTIIKFEPRTAVCQFSQVRAFAEHHFRSTPPIYKSAYDNFINIREEMELFHSTLYQPQFPGERIKGLVIVSPTRLGKTTWARSLGRHIYFNGQLNWDRYDKDARYAILDDIPMQFIPKKTQMFGCQQEFETSQKYQKVRSIKWGIPVIYLTNNSRFLDKEEDWFKDWFEQNMITINIFDKLYQ